MTDETTRNREIITRLYEAGTAGDMETFFGYVDPELTVYEPPFLEFAGVHRGIDAFKALFGSVVELVDVPSLKIKSLTVEGDRAIAVVQARTRKDNQPILLCEEWRLREGNRQRPRVVVGPDTRIR